MAIAQCLSISQRVYYLKLTYFYELVLLLVWRLALQPYENCQKTTNTNIYTISYTPANINIEKRRQLKIARSICNVHARIYTRKRKGIENCYQQKNFPLFTAISPKLQLYTVCLDVA